LEDFSRQASEKYLPIRRLLIALEFLHVVLSFYPIRPQHFLSPLISASPALTFDRSAEISAAGAFLAMASRTALRSIFFRSW